MRSNTSYILADAVEGFIIIVAAYVLLLLLFLSALLWFFCLSSIICIVCVCDLCVSVDGWVIVCMCVCTL